MNKVQKIIDIIKTYNAPIMIFSAADQEEANHIAETIKNYYSDYWIMCYKEDKWKVMIKKTLPIEDIVICSDKTYSYEDFQYVFIDRNEAKTLNSILKEKKYFNLFTTEEKLPSIKKTSILKYLANCFKNEK